MSTAGHVTSPSSLSVLQHSTFFSLRPPSLSPDGRHESFPAFSAKLLSPRDTLSRTGAAHLRRRQIRILHWNEMRQCTCDNRRRYGSPALYLVSVFSLPQLLITCPEPGFPALQYSMPSDRCCCTLSLSPASPARSFRRHCFRSLSIFLEIPEMVTELSLGLLFPAAATTMIPCPRDRPPR